MTFHALRRDERQQDLLLRKGSIGGNCLIYGHFPCSDTENRLSELYDSIVVKAFDEHSLTFQYGEKEYTITPEEGCFEFGETGMNYTTFWLSLRLKPDKSE